MQRRKKFKKSLKGLEMNGSSLYSRAFEVFLTISRFPVLFSLRQMQMLLRGFWTVLHQVNSENLPARVRPLMSHSLIRRRWKNSQHSIHKLKKIRSLLLKRFSRIVSFSLGTYRTCLKNNHYEFLLLHHSKFYCEPTNRASPYLPIRLISFLGSRVGFCVFRYAIIFRIECAGGTCS